MVVCYDEPAVRNAALEGVRTLVDRLPSAVEIDVDAVSDDDAWVAAVMQHVEEAGVHSGDSSCVLLRGDLAGDPQEIGRRLPARPRSGRRRCGQRPACGRRRRGVRARGQPACVADAPVREQGHRRQSRRRGLPDRGRATRRPRHHQPTAPSRTRRAGSASAAVLPFIRFPGADPVLGGDALDRRSDGERLGLRARSRRPNGRRAAASRRRHRVPVGSRRRQDGSGSARPCARPAGLLAGGHRGHGQDARVGWHSGRARPQGGGDWRGATRWSTSSAAVVVTSSSTRRAAAPARSDGYRIREAALSARIPCITTLAGARAAARAIANARGETVLSLQERIGAQARSA